MSDEKKTLSLGSGDRHAIKKTVAERGKSSTVTVEIKRSRSTALQQKNQEASRQAEIEKKESVTKTEANDAEKITHAPPPAAAPDHVLTQSEQERRNKVLAQAKETTTDIRRQAPVHFEPLHEKPEQSIQKEEKSTAKFKDKPIEVQSDEERKNKKSVSAENARKPVVREVAQRKWRGTKGITSIDSESDGSERGIARMHRKRQKKKIVVQNQAQKIARDVKIPEKITVQDLANRMAERTVDVIKELMRMGMMVTANQFIDADTAEIAATELGHKVLRVSDADVEENIKGEAGNSEDFVWRAPVVTVMGHVDHGKTSLLDALRKTNVVAKESGGITQHIGAYQVHMPDGKAVTFIDTPGHAAFTQMRARGARITDIVVLVVAADDGVMPQTIEAIKHAQAAKVPIIVAINKIDKPNINAMRIRTELLQHNVVLENMGGDVMAVEISAKMGTNIDKLLETILLQAEILDLKANPKKNAVATVIEARFVKGQGPVSTVLIQEGTLYTGDIFVAGGQWGRVRLLLNDKQERIKEAIPGMPVEVIGFDDLPNAGDELVVVENEAKARDIAAYRGQRKKDLHNAQRAKTGADILVQMSESGKKILPIIIKADVQGSEEAIVSAIKSLKTLEVQVSILLSGTGGITESDITLANASRALVFGFNVRANPQARDLAKRDQVDIRYHSIIYNLIDDIKGAVSGLLSPEYKENFLGYAEIRQVFNITKTGKIAGCMVTEGTIKRSCKVRLLRDGVVIHEGTLAQLKRFKDDVKEVRSGMDCGIALENYQDIQVGDVIECFEKEAIARTIE